MAKLLTPNAFFDVRLHNVNHRKYADDVDDVRSHVVRVEVDLRRLAEELGQRACTSKGGKAIEAGGAVVVRRLK